MGLSAVSPISQCKATLTKSPLFNDGLIHLLPLCIHRISFLERKEIWTVNSQQPLHTQDLDKTALKNLLCLCTMVTNPPHASPLCNERGLCPSAKLLMWLFRVEVGGRKRVSHPTLKGVKGALSESGSVFSSPQGRPVV